MIWFFERGSNEFLRIETSFDSIAGLYILRAQMPDGTEQVETFSDADACQARLEVLDQQLRADHWRLRQARPLP
jgi:hypothetical protein